MTSRPVVILSWRTQRFEIVFVVVMTAFAAMAAGIEIVRLDSIAPPAHCLVDFIRGGAVLPAGCAPIQAFQDLSYGEAARIMAAMAILPAVIGIVLTSGIVSREIEDQTAQLAWMLAPSRRRWLIDRMWLPLATAVLASALLAALSEGLEAARFPYLSPEASFLDYGLHGPLIVVRTVTYASLGLLCGSTIGRQLPSLLTSAVAALLLFGILTASMPFGQPEGPVATDAPSRADLVASARYRTPSGTLLTYDEASAQAPAGLSRDDTVVWVANSFSYVPWGVSEGQLPAVEVREAVLLLAVTAAAVASTSFIVSRRRPY